MGTGFTKEQMERIRQMLRGVDVKHNYKKLRKLYDSDKSLQFESFEDFVERMRKMKEKMDELKYGFRVRG